jgi:hypothetical protein
MNRKIQPCARSNVKGNYVFDLKSSSFAMIDGVGGCGGSGGKGGKGPGAFLGAKNDDGAQPMVSLLPVAPPPKQSLEQKYIYNKS